FYAGFELAVLQIRVFEARRIVSEHFPTIPPLSAEQFYSAAGACRFYQNIKLLRLPGMLSACGLQHGGVTSVQKYRLAPDRQQAVLGLSTQPFASTHTIFNPG